MVIKQLTSGLKHIEDYQLGLYFLRSIIMEIKLQVISTDGEILVKGTKENGGILKKK